MLLVPKSQELVHMSVPEDIFSCNVFYLIHTGYSYGPWHCIIG